MQPPLLLRPSQFAPKLLVVAVEGSEQGGQILKGEGRLRLHFSISRKGDRLFRGPLCPKEGPSLPPLRNDRIEVKTVFDELAQLERNLLFAMDHKDLKVRIPKVREPIEKPFLVRMS